MSHFHNEPPFTHGTPRKTGILLVNLGTPDQPTPAAVRRYLKEFLWDARVVEIPRLLWWLILNGVILNVRPKKTAKKYQSIWLPEGSPLRVYTERQAQMLRGYLGEIVKSPLTVVAAMRYGNPSIEAGLAKLRAQYCDNVLVLPLYPQYAASTTASTFDQVARILMRQRNVPGLRLVRSFHDHPAYIAAIARNVQAFWTKAGRPDFSTSRLLMTFHGLPRFHLDKGDPYHCQCHKSARLIGEALGLAPDQYLVTFQSRFGTGEWLQPYTGETLETLAQQGIRRIDIICPGFAADCLETLKEIAIEGREIFLHARADSVNREFHYIPVANDTPAFVGALAEIIREHLSGWIGENRDSQTMVKENELSAQRAKKRGAAQ